jgi:hypothetical protein
LLGADEDADAMLRLGVKIAQGFADPVYYEAVRGQRMQRFLASGIVGDLNTKTGGEQIKLFFSRDGRLCASTAYATEVPGNSMTAANRHPDEIAADGLRLPAR